MEVKRGSQKRPSRFLLAAPNLMERNPFMLDKSQEPRQTKKRSDRLAKLLLRVMELERLKQTEKTGPTVGDWWNSCDYEQKALIFMYSMLEMDGKLKV
jgi:hypothetical protein